MSKIWKCLKCGAVISDDELPEVSIVVECGEFHAECGGEVIRVDEQR